MANHLPVWAGRIKREAAMIAKQDYKTDAIPCIELTEGDFSRWSASLNGPPDSPFEGAEFHLLVNVPREYPQKAPVVWFITPIYHPNIDIASGGICLDLLNSSGNWSPTLTVEKVLVSVLSLLCDPNPDHGLNNSALSLFRKDKKKYNEAAKRHTENWAKKNVCIPHPPGRHPWMIRHARDDSIPLPSIIVSRPSPRNSGPDDKPHSIGTACIEECGKSALAEVGDLLRPRGTFNRGPPTPPRAMPTGGMPDPRQPNPRPTVTHTPQTNVPATTTAIEQGDAKNKNETAILGPLQQLAFVVVMLLAIAFRNWLTSSGSGEVLNTPR